MENIQLDNLIISHSMDNHPLARARDQTKQLYLSVLTHFLNQHTSNDEYIRARLLQYCTMLIENAAARTLTEKNCDSAIRSVVNNPLKPWTWKQCIWLMCDIALITTDRDAIMQAQETMGKFLGTKQCTLLNTLIDMFFSKNEIPRKLFFAKSLISQFRINQRFSSQPKMRVLITANMSAGKSTLINALVGKPVVKTSLEACTANLCYLFNKPYEDNAIHLISSYMNLNASYNDLMHVEKASISYIASYFRALVEPKARICVIDTPGVNSAIYQDHGTLTYHALADEKYDKLVYVLNANALGTDDEMRYLKYVSENVPKDKVIFVLNKLDNFKNKEDSIAASFVGIRNNLLQLGYENPALYPLSAYCALLVKMKLNGEVLTADEEDDYCFYVKKFSKAEYDLSNYSREIALPMSSVNDELLTLATKCGLYGFESMLYGGMIQ